MERAAYSTRRWGHASASLNAGFRQFTDERGGLGDAFRAWIEIQVDDPGQ